MKLVKAETRKLNGSQLVDKSAYVEGMMTGNVNFPAPVPAIASLTAARTALTTALENAQSGAHADTVVKNQAVKTLDGLLNSLCRYVNSVSAGDADKAVSSGFELIRQPDPVDHLDAPTSMKASSGSYIGSVDLRWKRVRGARMYNVYVNTTDPTKESEWKPAGVSSKAKYTVINQVSGGYCSFRVTALGRVGEGPTSEVIGCRAA